MSNSRGDDYVNLTGQPLFPFGYGLSYTTFQYDDLKIIKPIISTNDSAMVSFNVSNVGTMAGDEVAQMYLRDELASVVRPVMELRGFKRVHLQPKETKNITFWITPEDLEMYNVDMKKVIEPGDFRILVGASSKDIRLKGKLKVQKND